MIPLTRDNMRTAIALVLAAGLFAPPSAALAARDAGLPGEFLNYGVGSRPLGMGRAYTGVADDIDSLYWNPAGLSTYRSSQVEFQHSPLVLGGAYQYLAFSQPLYAMGHFGIGAVNLASGNVPRIDSNNVEVGSFSDRETAYLLAYAHRVKERFDLGVTAKMAEHSIDGRTARGYGADLGSLYRVSERFKVGAMVRNAVRPVYRYSSDKETFPMIVRTGASMKFFDGHLLTALDVEKTVGARQAPKWHLGMEGYAIQNVFLRLGVDQHEFTGGVGVRWKTMQFDYAAGLQDLDLISRVSMKFYFGGYEADVKAKPAVFSPVGLKNKTNFKIAVRNRQRIVNWILSVRNAKGDVVRSFQGFNAPPSSLEWDARDANDQIVGPGEYVYRMAVTDNKNRTEMTPARSLRIDAPTPFEIEAK